MVRLGFGLVLAVGMVCPLAALPSCGSSSCEETRTCASSGGASDGGKTDASNGFTISVDTPALTIVTGGTTTLKVHVVRTGTAADVTLDPSGLPSGVNLTPLSIAASETSKDLTVSADATAAQGSASVKLTCTSAGESHQASFTLDVVGAPGTMDTTLGTNGYMTVGWGVDGLVGPVIGTGDSMTFLGSHAQALAALELKRLTADGQLDSTFANGGTASFPSPFDSNERLGTALIGDATGRLLVGDVLASSGTNLISVARFDGTGTLDSSFGTAGEIGGVGSGLQGAVLGLALDPNGKIILAGAAYNPPAAFLGRATDTGPDPGFANSGGTNFSSFGKPLGRGIALPLPDGSCVGAFGLGGITAPDGGMVVRADANGQHVSGFGVDAIATVTLGIQAAVYTGDDIILGGTWLGGAVVALKNDGTPDLNFGSAGVTHVGSSVLALATDAQGRILAAANGSPNGWSLARMDAGGKLDSTFGNAGISDFTGSDTPIGLATRADGHIVVGLSLLDSGGTLSDLRIVEIWP